MNRSATPRFPAFLHGGDYNPEQWLKYPEILEKDVELMREAKVNCVSLGIFSWAFLEPEEGVYDFAWMDRVIERLWSAGIHVDLATPSGARPAWLAEKYPEVLRVDDRFHRQHFGARHNHCPSSPVYREKVRAIDTALARRYAHHPAVILWHISNEFSGDCRCPLCQERFRTWLQDRYGSLEALNDHWWTGFWSMRYTSWSQVEPPSHRGQNANPAIWVDWRRFSTWQCRSFIEMEKAALHAVNPDIPVTANLMHRFWDYDYFELAKPLDVVSWDSYPAWGMGDDLREASEHAMTHDLMRSLKDRPFLLMESTPSQVNWHDVNKLKKPGMHLLSSMLARETSVEPVTVLLFTAGLGMVLSNGVLAFIGPQYLSAMTPYTAKSMKVLGMYISIPKAISFGIALVSNIGLNYFLQKSETGRAIRATSQNRHVASLMGVNMKQIYNIAFGIAIAMVGLSGALLLPYSTLNPDIGNVYSFKCFVIVILGGMGSTTGALLGGLLVGVIERLGTLFFSDSVAQTAVFVVFMLVLLFRPYGLLGKKISM